MNKTQRAATLVEIADLDHVIGLADEQLAALAAVRTTAVERRAVLQRRFPRPPMVLACTDCSATFDPATQMSRLLGHTIEKHGRRPFISERTPVDA